MLGEECHLGEDRRKAGECCKTAKVRAWGHSGRAFVFYCSFLRLLSEARVPLGIDAGEHIILRGLWPAVLLNVDVHWSVHSF